MKQIFIFISLILLSNLVIGQNTFKALVRIDNTKEILKGATAVIPDLKIMAKADTNGFITINNIPNGKFEIEITYVGYGKSEKVCTFPRSRPDDIVEVDLEPSSGELAEVRIQTTRTNQNLWDIPTRIEALPLEELDEKSTMRPGDIKMLLLGEATGIRV